MAIEIAFIDVSKSVPEIYHPYPTTKALPSWYKDLEPWVSGVDSNMVFSPEKIAQTGKRCLPLFDAMTAGYVIPLAFDIYVGRDEVGEKRYSWPNAEHMTNTRMGIEFHPNAQMSTFKKAKDYSAIPKISSPWAISTPPGYSVLVVPPLNRDESVIEIFSGVMDTDTFNSAGSFPFLLSDPNFVGVIPAGTPFAQVIPFKRNDFKMRIGNDKDFEKIKNSNGVVGRSFRDAYRKHMHSKKNYR